MSDPVTGDHDVHSSTAQPPAQRRAESECIVGKERGVRCLPVVPGSHFCDNHSPDRREQRREIARLAARASHTRRVTPEMEQWADSMDLTTEEGRAQSLSDVAKLVAKEALTPAQGNAIAALARAASLKTMKSAEEPKALIVEVARFDSPPGVTS